MPKQRRSRLDREVTDDATKRQLLIFDGWSFDKATNSWVKKGGWFMPLDMAWEEYKLQGAKKC